MKGTSAAMFAIVVRALVIRTADVGIRLAAGGGGGSW